MYVYVDDRAVICGYNPTDMSGTSGWEPIQEAISEPIFNEQGVPLYKYAGGLAVSRTAEEIAADAPEPEEAQVTEVEQLRADVDYIAVMEGIEL